MVAASPTSPQRRSRVAYSMGSLCSLLQTKRPTVNFQLFGTILVLSSCQQNPSFGIELARSGMLGLSCLSVEEIKADHAKATQAEELSRLA